MQNTYKQESPNMAYLERYDVFLSCGVSLLYFDVSRGA